MKSLFWHVAAILGVVVAVVAAAANVPNVDEVAEAAEQERAARDARAWMLSRYESKVCAPGQVAEWVDDKTMQCFRVLSSPIAQTRPSEK